MGGVVEIYGYNNRMTNVTVERSAQTGEARIYAIIDPDKQFYELFLRCERPVPPRTSRATYIGYPLECLDICDLPDGDRVLITKSRYWRANNRLQIVFDNFDFGQGRRDVSRLFEWDDVRGAVGAIKIIMRKLVGISERDAEVLSTEVRRRLEDIRSENSASRESPSS